MSNEDDNPTPSNPIPVPDQSPTDHGHLSWSSTTSSTHMFASPENHQGFVTPRRFAPIQQSQEAETASNSYFGSPQSARPSMGNRSTSSPLFLRRRQGVSPSRTAHGVTSALMTTLPQPERQWSLFEQLMENHGQLRSPSLASRRSGLSRAGAGNRMSTSTQSDGTEAGESHTSSLTQSPVLERQATPFHDGVEPSGTPVRLPSLAEYDSDDYDSDDSSGEGSGTATPTGPPHLVAQVAPPKTWSSRIPHWMKPSSIPVLYRNILKCAVAYFIASLFTFSPYLSSLMSDLTSYGVSAARTGGRPTASGHMVATM